MTSVRFRAGAIDLELRGSESFVTRQLQRFAPMLGPVDSEALEPQSRPLEAPATNPPATPESQRVAGHDQAPGEALDEGARPADAGSAGLPGRAANGNGAPRDELLSFFQGIEPNGSDPQADAALLFAYYLQHREGRDSLALGDLIRCCIRAGVDTRNFNRTLGTLTRRGFLQTVRHGHAYVLSEQGAAAVESRM